MDSIGSNFTLIPGPRSFLPGAGALAAIPVDDASNPRTAGETVSFTPAALARVPRAADEAPGSRRAESPAPGSLKGSAPAGQLSVQAFCDAAWSKLAVRGTGGSVFGEQAEARRCVLGEPRLNRPYPDPDLLAAGIPQDLPLTVTSPFKWLLHPPLPMGDGVLLHAQFEGGPGFCDNEELECRDLFIALRRDEATGRFVETGHLRTRPPEYGYVYRSTASAESVPGSDHHFMVHLEEGTYSSGIFGRHTHLYCIDDDAIREVGRWDGHLAADADPIRQQLRPH